MNRVFNAMQIWLLIALASLGCSLLVGGDAYRDGYWLFAMGCWLVLDVYWGWAARHTKPVVASGRFWEMPAATFLIYASYCLPLSSVPLLGERILPRAIVVQASGALLCAFGVAFAIWSRHVLAESWNAAVTRGEEQSLVRRGPYAIVRHPIYLGFLVAVMGMVLVLGELRGIALLLAVQVLLRKMGQEESVLRAAFPNHYPEYEQRVRRLLPWIW